MGGKHIYAVVLFAIASHHFQLVNSTSFLSSFFTGGGEVAADTTPGPHRVPDSTYERMRKIQAQVVNNSQQYEEYRRTLAESPWPVPLQYSAQPAQAKLPLVPTQPHTPYLNKILQYTGRGLDTDNSDFLRLLQKQKGTLSGHDLSSYLLPDIVNDYDIKSPSEKRHIYKMVLTYLIVQNPGHHELLMNPYLQSWLMNQWLSQFYSQVGADTKSLVNLIHIAADPVDAGYTLRVARYLDSVLRASEKRPWLKRILKMGLKFFG